MYPKYLSVVLLITLMLLNKVSAQDSITIFCDTTFNPDETRVPDPFPGAYYRVLSGRGDESTYVFERIDQSGTTQLTSPFSIEESQRLLQPSVSPNGRYIVFQPLTVN